MDLEIGGTLAPKSEQMDAIDLVTGPRIFTITDITGGTDEQPINVHLDGFPRPWRPGVTMRRLMFKAWGGQRWREYIGRQVELYNDESVRFGPDQTGGIRIRSLSHIGNESVTHTLPISKTKYGKFTVQPLTERSVKEPTVDPKVAALKAEWHDATPERREEILTEVATLTGGAA